MKDDGRMTPDCAKCSKWKDDPIEGGDCTLPKDSGILECPYMRKMMLSKCHQTPKGGN